MLISKDHLKDLIGVDTPGVGYYKVILSTMVDEIKLKNDLTQVE